MFFALVAVAALVVVAGAAAANGGFTPVQPHSPNAKHINTTYYVILGFTSAIFVLVAGALGTFIVKYRGRGRPRTEDGAQVHGHTRLGLIVVDREVYQPAVEAAALVFVLLEDVQRGGFGLPRVGVRAGPVEDDRDHEQIGGRRGRRKRDRCDNDRDEKLTHEAYAVALASSRDAACHGASWSTVSRTSNRLSIRCIDSSASTLNVVS